MGETNYFNAIPSNKSIENHDPHRNSNAAKGAFTDEARDQLAKAVQEDATTVTMDEHTMEIRYFDTYVAVTAINHERLPHGTFDLETLRRRVS